MSTCPSDETLARLGHDSLDGAEWAAVEAHVQRCEKCVGSLEKLLAHDTATAPASALLPAEENLPHIPGFEIEGELGRGGMGVVYRAWEPKLARTVALKIVPSGPMTGSRERKRWLAEARCVTRVCHPNIVQIHDAGEADGWLYLVLEFVPGGSLKERLRGPLPPRAAAELMRPVAAAMTAVHAAGLLHLDLKPSNILLDSAPDAAWQRRVSQGRRFRYRPAPGRSGRVGDEPGRAVGDALLHGAGAGDRVPRRRRRGGRHPRPGRHPVRAADRPPAVPGSFDAGNARSGPRPETRASTAAESEDPPRPGNHRSQVPGEEPLPALRLGRGTGRRPEPLPGRPSDQGEARLPDRARLALVPPSTCDRGPGSNFVTDADREFPGVIGTAAAFRGPAIAFRGELPGGIAIAG